jgi:hypothetical protein
MKTYVKTFKFNYFDEVQSTLNEFFCKRNLTPLSISMSHNGGNIYVAVVIEKNEGIKKTCLNCGNQYSKDGQVCITSNKPYATPSHWKPIESEGAK